MATEQNRKSVLDYKAEMQGLSAAEQADFWVIQMDEPMTEEQEMAFRLWLKSSPENRPAYDAARQVWALAGTAATLSAPLSNDGHQTPPRRASLVLIRAAFAVAAVIIAGVFLLQNTYFAPANHITALNGFEKFTLADGSLATLDAGAEISINFDDNTRVVDLEKGGILVEVAHNKAKPFIIAATGIQVRAVGTAYSVEVTHSKTHVAVFEGVIEISDPTANNSPVQLTAGQSWYMTDDMADGQTIRQNRVAGAYWHQKQLKAENQSLGEVLEKLSRHNGEDVLWISPDIRSLEISGLFQLDNASFLLDFLQKEYHIEKYELFGRSAFFLKNS